MDKIEGGGSFSVCPDTGAVTAQHEIEKARAAEEAAKVEAAKAEAKPAKLKNISKE